MKIQIAIANNTTLTRNYNKQAFESSNSKRGLYRFDRYHLLKTLI
jgi:hypothetical protein